MNSVINGGAGLVVEKIGGGAENGTQSSTQHHHHPRDVIQLGDKKPVHVRTDWAAKYLK